MSTEVRGIVSEKFMLNLDGVECGYLQSLTIGGITTNVTSPPARPTHHAKKHRARHRRTVLWADGVCVRGLALKRDINRAYGVGIELYCKQRFDKENGTFPPSARLYHDEIMHPQAEKKRIKAI